MDLISIKRDGQYAILSLTDVAAAINDHVTTAKERGFNDVNMKAAAEILVDATRSLNKILLLYDHISVTPHRLFQERVIEYHAHTEVSILIASFRDKQISLDQFKESLNNFIHGLK